MDKGKNNSSSNARRKKVKVIKAHFDEHRRKQEELEYEKYYLRIRNLSRGL